MFGRILVWVLLCACATSAAAQQITGTLRRALDSLPVSGALVVLSDSSGRDVARTVSDDRGRFGFAISGGPFRVRVLRIGMRPFSEGVVSTRNGGRVSLDLYVRDDPIVLSAMTIAAAPRRCGAPPDTSVLGVLLVEARKVLDLTEATLAERRFVFAIEMWRRRQTPELHTLDSVPQVAVDRAWPIRSAPPESLRVWGFVRDEPDSLGNESTTYFGPDARVLFADWFLNTHCLRMAARPAPGLIAMDFRPERITDLVNIAGRFVFDSASLELRELSWRWIALPTWAPDQGPGGLVRFRAMPQGGWLPVAWSLRAPVATRSVTRGMQLSGYLEFGGRVLSQGDEAQALRAIVDRPRTATIDGTVSDTSGHPVAEARVSVRPTGTSALSDSAGRFRLPELRPGTSILHVMSIGYAPADFAVHVRPDSTLRVDIRLTPRVFVLDTVSVSANTELPGLAIVGFYERKRRREMGAGTSSFVTPEQIERRRPGRVSDLLQALPGVTVLYEHNVAVPHGRLMGCIMNIWIDGANVDIYGTGSGQVAYGKIVSLTGAPPQLDQPYQGGIDAYLSVEQVAAIEVYQTPSETPPEFENIANTCGTIAIWTGSRKR